LPLEVVVRRREVQRTAARALPMRDAALERIRAGEKLVDQRADHGKDRDAGNPAERDAVEPVREEDAAGHGDSKDEENHADRRAIFILDMDFSEAAHAVLITAQGISADLFHFVLQTDLKFASMQTYAVEATNGIRFVRTSDSASRR
jgi:hypothetical protein